MDLPMKGQLSKQISVAKHIIDGSITIDSVKEFQGMLQIFPNDPALHRAYADLLVRKKLFKAAEPSYQRAADLYAAAGLLLQAVVCQVLKWRIHPPTDAQTQKFWDFLHKSKYHEIPTNTFLACLSHTELVNVMNAMQLMRLPAGKTVNKIGDEENALYFIVSGNIKATTYEPLEKDDSEHRKTNVYLAENDFFGHIYPLNESKLSHCYTETIGYAELVKISRNKLIQTCRRHPRIELGLIDLFKARSNEEEVEALRAVRKAERHKLPVQMNLKIWPGTAGYYGLILDGLSRDISVGGMCIELDAKYANVPSIYKNIKNAKIEITMPSEAMTINVLGSIVWSNEVYHEEQPTVALGIRFEEMSPQMSGLLVVFANTLNQTT
jgi:CRP-like cAMP-binding protein